MDKPKISKMLKELSDISNSFNELIKRFDETGCWSLENPNHNQNWCSCGKPFCYECFANRIAINIQNKGYRKFPDVLPVLTMSEEKAREKFSKWHAITYALGYRDGAQAEADLIKRTIAGGE
jgi:hypothetical protein